MSNRERITANNASIQACIDKAKTLPDAGSGGGSGTIADDRVKYVTFMCGETELIKYPVIEGDTCRDPITNNIIEAPTKEPTIDTVYSFGGWSLADDGIANSDALKNVTENRTVYLVYAESVRKYTVNFYDGDTLIKSEQVAYGGSSEYTYAKEDYIFVGWSPTPTNITSDIDCYAQWVEGVDFATVSWSKISEISEAGMASAAFKIGDTRTVNINGSPAEIEIIGFNHDDKSDGSGKAGITVWVRSLSAIFPARTAYNSVKSWLETDCYTQDILNVTLEDELAAVVKTVSKAYEYADNLGYWHYNTIATKFWMISGSELGFEITGTAGAEGTVYEKFSSGKVYDTKMTVVYTDIKLLNSYWIRSHAKGSSKFFYPMGITSGGYLLTSGTSAYRYYPSLCFCI